MDKVLYISGQKEDLQIFHTLEGEGKNIGKSALFLRLSMCNLTCKGWATPENPNGCDSKSAWMIKNKFTHDELIKYFEDKGFDSFVKRGDILKLTGGEPFLQEESLYEWCGVASYNWNCELNIEFETNATLVPKCAWNSKHASFICSPKLSNNGDPLEKRYKPEVLLWHAENTSSTFKFVVTNEFDVGEIFKNYITPFNIDHSRVWLMPECATTKQFKEKAPWVAELCKEHGFNFSPRLQILIWEQALGR